MTNRYLSILFVVMTSFFSSAQAANTEKIVSDVLNAFHQAAAKANAKEYLDLLNDDAIFLGTDASERWTKKQFTEFVLPYFEQGKGWLYVATERNISFSQNNTMAFFDEVLMNKSYGRCRGSGVLVNTKSGWKISQYSLSFLVPNDIASQVTEKIKNYEQQK